MMLRACFALFFAAILCATGCGGNCKISSQCESGQHCDFTTGECVPGCTSDSDCTSGCDLESGKCRTVDRPRVDSGTSTTTSTTPDASLPD